ncbi:MAG: sodium:alanine symporter family protein [Halieaceae bacterium]|jgi:AGCS family alanine or glycine:cation symporter|nr:sodium:alanine symporter family protein [Halieaceae bacterium]
MAALIDQVNSWVWGPVMLLLILGTGVYLTLGLRFMTLLRIPMAFRLLFTRTQQGSGDISPFGALMTALSATIGTGNIAGVATALALGGPGALFWMWVAALFGLATKYAEAVLAVHFRERGADGDFRGGPMYYIRNGLGERWRWLAFAFALFGALAGFGLANTVQSNSVSQVLDTELGIAPLLTGLVLAALVGAVILGGIQRIAQVTSVLVPFMALAYVSTGLVLIVSNIGALPAALSTIVSSAFTGAAAGGGFAGATMLMALRMGVARGVFSNEAGLGSAPIAHAAARTSDPVRQGTIAMLGTFIDTLVVCSITGIAIVMTAVLETGETGADLTRLAFSRGIPGAEWVVTLGLCLFAVTTMIGWSYYGERCIVYLLGDRAVLPFRVAWVIAIPLGTVMQLDTVWKIADILNAFMAVPNLVALLLLSPVLFELSRAGFASADGQRGVPAPDVGVK